MNNYVEHEIDFSTQAAGSIATPLPSGTPLSLVEVVIRTTAVAGSPTDVTAAITLTDGTTTKTPIAATSIGTTAAQTHLKPAATAMADGDHSAPAEEDWRAAVTFAFTGGTSPTVTGRAVLRFAV